MINSKIMYLCVYKIHHLNELNIKENILSEIKLFDIDIPNKCLYYYDGENIKKSCWRNKEEMGFKKSHIITSVKDLTKLYFNLLGKNLFYSTKKGLYIMNIETKYTKTLFELENIHYFKFIEGEKYLFSNIRTMLIVAGDNNDQTSQNSKVIYVIDIENRQTLEKIEIQDEIITCYIDSFSILISCNTKNQVLKISRTFGLITKVILFSKRKYWKIHI